MEQKPPVHFPETRTVTIHKRYYFYLVALLLAVGAHLSRDYWKLNAEPYTDAPPLPEFTHSDSRDWIGSPPLKLADLRGQVLLIDVWTFDCWNCYRSFPWLNGLETKLHGKPFQAIGVHSPEFDHERDPSSVREKMQEFGLRHPTMIDNDFSYWEALGNKYWPTYYVVDKQGRIRGRFFGETHAGGRQARAIETLLEELLAER